MRSQCYLLLVLFHLQTAGQVLFELYPDTVKHFVYEGGDEFNARSLNTDLWKNGIGGRRVLVVQDLAFDPSNVKFTDNLIVFVADKNDSNYVLTQGEVDSSYFRRTKRTVRENRFQVKYSAGAIVSKKKFHYGVYELRFKVEEGKGTWPAFWFYGGTKNDEIDVFEMKGERNDEIHVDVHCPSGCAHGYRKTALSLPRSYGSWIKMSEHLHEGFNNVMLDWRENELYWYINGLPFAYFRGEFSKPMNLYLNTSVAKTGEAFSPGPDSTTNWPINYYVDFLRIWKPGSETDSLTLRVGDFKISAQFPAKSARPEKRRGVAYSKKKLRQLHGTVEVTRPERNSVCISTLGCINDRGAKIRVRSGTTAQELTASTESQFIKIPDGEDLLVLEMTYNKRTFVRNLYLR